jgi:hypothetical protein
MRLAAVMPRLHFSDQMRRIDRSSRPRSHHERDTIACRHVGASSDLAGLPRSASCYPSSAGPFGLCQKPGPCCAPAMPTETHSVGQDAPIAPEITTSKRDGRMDCGSPNAISMSLSALITPSNHQQNLPIFGCDVMAGLPRTHSRSSSVGSRTTSGTDTGQAGGSRSSSASNRWVAPVWITRSAWLA